MREAASGAKNSQLMKNLFHTRSSSFWLNSFAGFVDERLAQWPELGAEGLQEGRRLFWQLLHQDGAVLLHVLLRRLKVDPTKFFLNGLF